MILSLATATLNYHNSLALAGCSARLPCYQICRTRIYDICGCVSPRRIRNAPLVLFGTIKASDTVHPHGKIFRSEPHLLVPPAIILPKTLVQKPPFAAHADYSRLPTMIQSRHPLAALDNDSTTLNGSVRLNFRPHAATNIRP